MQDLEGDKGTGASFIEERLERARTEQSGQIGSGRS